MLGLFAGYILALLCSMLLLVGRNCHPLFPANTRTFFATAHPISDASVFGGVFMTPWTMGFENMSCDNRIPPDEVLPSCYWFQVARVAARPVSAQVVKVESLGDIPLGKLVGHTMRQAILAARVDPPVTISVSAGVFPAVTLNTWRGWNHCAPRLDFIEAPVNPFSHADNDTA